jgi:hypothetical protein
MLNLEAMFLKKILKRWRRYFFSSLLNFALNESGNRDKKPFSCGVFDLIINKLENKTHEIYKTERRVRFHPHETWCTQHLRLKKLRATHFISGPFEDLMLLLLSELRKYVFLGFKSKNSMFTLSRMLNYQLHSVRFELYNFDIKFILISPYMKM